MTIQFWLSLSALWVILHLYRSYQVDAYRFQLFQLRGQLFRLAMNGKVAFEDPAYRMLRELLNCEIRFAHRMNFIGVLILRRSYRGTVAVGNQSQQVWESAKANMPTDCFKELQSIRSKLYISRCKQLVLTSFILQVSLLALFIWIAFCTVGRTFRNRIWAWICHFPSYESLCQLVDNGLLLGTKLNVVQRN